MKGRCLVVCLLDCLFGWLVGLFVLVCLFWFVCLYVGGVTDQHSCFR